MTFIFLGRSKDEWVLHSPLRGDRTEVESVKSLETWGLIRLSQLFGQEFTYLATQNREKKEGKSVSSPPPLALEW